MSVLTIIASCAHFAVSPVQAMIEVNPEPQCLDEVPMPDWHKLPLNFNYSGHVATVVNTESYLAEIRRPCARPDPAIVIAALEAHGGLWTGGYYLTLVNLPVPPVIVLQPPCDCSEHPELPDYTPISPPIAPIPLPASAWLLLMALGTLVGKAFQEKKIANHTDLLTGEFQ